MLPIIICDDQGEYRTYLKETINKFICIEELDMKVVLSARTAEQVLNHIAENPTPFLYFLDVNLKASAYGGMELAAQIRKHDPRGFIVFITVHSELSHMAFQYQVEAMDYILKDEPQRIPWRIKQCLLHAGELFSSGKNDKTLFLRQEAILCIQASSSAHKIKIFTKEGAYEQSGSLKEMAVQLNEQFLLCHKSWIVNTAHIWQFDKKRRILILSDGMECPVSFRRIKAFFETK